MILFIIYLGSVHLDDTVLVFNDTFRSLRPDEQIISRNMIQMIEGFATCDKGLMRYDNCQFVNNLGQKKMQVLHITRDGCENLQIDVLL